MKNGGVGSELHEGTEVNELKMRADTKDYFGKGCYVGPFLFLIGFGLLPFLLLAFQSFSALNEAGRFSVAWSLDGYREILQPHRVSVLMNILRRGITVATLDVLLAVPTAYVLTRMLGNRARTVCLFGFTVPFLASDVTRAFSWNIILGQHGLINRILLQVHLINVPLQFLIFSDFAVVVALVSSTLSFAVFPIVISLSTVPANLWLVAKDIGLSRFRELVGIALPLAQPGIVFGFIATLVVTISSAAESEMLGGIHQTNLVRVVSDLEGARKLTAVFALSTLFACSLGIMCYGAARILRNVAPEVRTGIRNG